jgi:hypothetical protein
MKTIILISAVIVAGALSIFAAKPESLIGTWCVGEDGMVLTFAGKDTLIVSSTADESVNGTGTYQKTDSSFVATIINGDLTMKMSYKYRWSGADTVKAKAELFTVNGDSISYPVEWMFMTRCKKSSDQVKAEPQKTAQESKSRSKDKKSDKK